MYQNDRGSYRTNESLAYQFRHSCLGQIIIAVVVIGLMLLIAAVTRPSEQKVQTEIRDDIQQCIEERDSLHSDWIDDVVSNTYYMFSSADSLKDNGMMKYFDRYNELRYYNHAFLTTVYLHNNFQPEGKRCGVGVFGMVIPMLSFNDFILQDEMMRSDTINQRLIEVNFDGEYFGENPGLEPYRFRGE